MLWICGIIPGVIFLILKIKAQNYFRQLEQKIQHDASQIDNYLEQRVVILSNAAKLLDKAIDLDKDTLTQIAAYRGGANPDNDALRNEIATKVDNVAAKIKFIVAPTLGKSRNISVPFKPSGQVICITVLSP